MKIEDQMIMSLSTLEYMLDNLGWREEEFSFDVITRLAEWHDQEKYLRMI